MLVNTHWFARATLIKWLRRRITALCGARNPHVPRRTFQLLCALQLVLHPSRSLVQRFPGFRKTVFAAPLLCMLFAIGSEHVIAQIVAPVLPAQATTGMPSLKAIGGGLLRIFGFQIYNAYLWTPEGASFDQTKPHVLDIHYLRTFSAKQLAERSIDEMRGQGIGSEAVYPKWITEMQRVFADVKEGDRLIGVATPARTAKFFYNGAYRGEVADAAFTDAFFGIFLGEKSSQPGLRERLLGKR